MSQEAFFRLRRCARGLFSLSGLLALGLLFANIAEAQVWYPKCNLGAYPNMCCWSGTAPVCLAGCPNGFDRVGDSKDADGALATCSVGTHKLCCPSAFASFVAPSDSFCKPQNVEQGEGILGLALRGE
jgi:hypothetical protein